MRRNALKLERNLKNLLWSKKDEQSRYIYDE